MMMRLLLAGLLAGSSMLSASVPRLAAQDAYPPAMPTMEAVGSAIESGQGASTPNPVLWQQYQALQTGTPVSGCQACGNGGMSVHNRCGCQGELFPWIDGPGNCDQWCVGPKWEVQADGLMLFREDADLASVIAAIGGTTSLVDQFDHGIGGRVFVTGYNESGFGMQVGWEGVDTWTANITFDPVGTETRTIGYESGLNSVEINFLPQVPYTWKLFTGFRYVELDEGFVDARVNDKPIPAPIAVPAAPTAVIDTTVSRLLRNQLIGFQVGGRRDTWHMSNRWSIDSFINAGVYCNKFRRDDITRTDTTIITGDDIDTPENEFSQVTTSVETKVRTSPTEVAFLGEAGVNSTLKITQCVALRAGYQVLAIDGVGQGIDAFFASGLNGNTLLYHGLQFGVEYRR
ncbi:MAG: BBP7 family outer membrane beta-barrel protein [Planctomycetales bacterium]|nr:BBP7 family outer membrane beta-barrel protein [Planctomycetales bacterium]